MRYYIYLIISKYNKYKFKNIKIFLIFTDKQPASVEGKRKSI